MFLLISVRHVGAHPGEHQHDVSIQISISLGKTFLRILSLELNGCPVAPFVHAHFRSRARDFFILCQFSTILYKSEALENFYRLLKQNIKSYNAKQRRQRDRLKKTAIGLISKKATLHVQHTFFVHFFAVVLNNCNVKRPETSCLHVSWRQCRPCSCSLSFFTVAQFHPGGR